MSGPNDRRIHPSAVIEDGVQLPETCRIGPFCHLHRGSVIGPNCELDTGVVLYGGSVLGEAVQVFPHAVIGAEPQFLGWDREIESGVEIGNGCVLREGVTVHRSIRPGDSTRIGKGCYLMAQAHVAHDCRIEDRVVIANGCQLAGHVEVGDGAFLGGGALFHQFVRVGRGAMIGGGAVVTKDIAPFLMVAERNRIAGLNRVGLKRAGVSSEVIDDLKRCYRGVLGSLGNAEEAAERLRAEGHCGWTTEGQYFLQFLARPSKRGIAKPSLAGPHR